MPLLTSRALIATKLEATEGTDAMGTPGTADAGTHALCSRPEFTVESDEFPREIAVPHLSPLGTVIGAGYGRLRFSTELRGRAAVPTSAAPLRDNPLWIACAMSPVYAASSAVYKPSTAVATSAGLSTATIYAWLDGILHILTGARGTVKLTAEAGKLGMLEWEMQGLFTRIAGAVAASAGVLDVAMPTLSADAFATKPPTILGASLSVHALSTMTVQQLTLDLQNEVQMRSSITGSNGYAGCVITDRKPQFTVNPEAVLRATHDFWQRWAQATEGTIQLDWGGTVGNKGRALVTAAQYGRPQWGDRNGIRTYEITGSCNAASSGGDDELEIHFS